LSWAMSRAGDPEGASTNLAALVPIYDEARFPYGSIFNGVYLGEAYLRAERHERAVAVLEITAERATALGMRFYAGSACRLLAEAELRCGRLDDAFRHFDEAITELNASDAENELALAYLGLAALHNRRREDMRAADFERQAREIFARLGTMVDAVV